MKKTLIVAGIATLLSGPSFAATLGVSIANFDDNGLTIMRTGMTTHADSLDDVELQMEDAQEDVARQLDQINNFIASGVDAIIVNAVDTEATEAMSQAASSAGVPLVYVNRQPGNMDTLPDQQAFVASNEIESGTLAAFRMCQDLRAAGKSEGATAYMLMGRLSNQAAVQRSKDFHDVIGMDMCNFITLIDEQSANWSRDEAQDMMTNWISSGEPFDAVFGNNDEMAIGAIQAMKSSGISMEDIVVGGVDATPDALVAMQAGEMDVTVFQDLAGQGAGSIDTALKLVNGEEVNKTVFIPFKLVTPENVEEFM